MRHRKEDPEQLPVTDRPRVEPDLDHFGVIRRATADLLVGGGLLAVTGVAGGDGEHPFEGLEDGFDTPETAASEYRQLLAARRILGDVVFRFGKVVDLGHHPSGRQGTPDPGPPSR